MKEIKVYVSEKDSQWLGELADLHGISVGDLIKTNSITQLREEYDNLNILVDFIQKNALSNVESAIPFEEVLRRLSIS